MLRLIDKLKRIGFTYVETIKTRPQDTDYWEIWTYHPDWLVGKYFKLQIYYGLGITNFRLDIHYTDSSNYHSSLYKCLFW
jgi:hypothetical protein